MKPFERSEDYQTQIFLDALDQHVVLDARVIIQHQGRRGSKLKAYCPATKTYLQFPRALRQFSGQVYIADVIKSKKSTGTIFYRAYKKSIRNLDGELI